MCNKPAYFIAFVMVLIVAHNATAGLVGHWTFDEDSGAVAADSSGNGNTGAVTGDAAWVAGQMGGSALNFDDSDDIVIIDDSPSLDIEDALTISLWVNTPEVVSPNHMVTKQPSGTAPDNYPGNYEFRVKDNTIQFLHQTSESTDYTLYISTSQITAGEWHHAAVSIVEGGSVEFYLDGAPAGSLPQLGAFGVLNDNSLRIGGRKDNHFFNGILDDVYIYARALTLDQIVGLGRGIEPAFRKAESPSIPDNSLFENTWANLTWTPGDAAVSHDVYVGDNFEDVDNGLDETFQGNQTATSLLLGFPGFAVPNGLVPGTTYYWRIDEVNDGDPDSPWKGDVWSFRVPPINAYSADPADKARFVLPDVTLEWTAGFNAKLHTVYFGDNFDEVDNASGSIAQTDTTFTPDALEADRTYYWRVDEFDGFTTHKGDVWNFTTMPVIPLHADPDLVAWWTFDEGQGMIALDWSGHGNHATLFGSEWVTPGALGSTALRIGDSGAIQNLSYAAADLTEVTVTAWVRTSSASDQYIVSFDRNEYYRLEINGNGAGPGQVGWDVMTSSGQVDYGSISRVDDGAWHHVAGVYDKGLMTIYVDGVAEPSATGGPTYGSGNTRFGFIGANSEATSFNGSKGGGSAVTGEVDDIRIYHRALTQEEIAVVIRGNPKLAGSPAPDRDAIVDIRDISSLNWSKGDTAASHDVYFGTDRDAVANADNNSPEFQGNQAVTSLSLATLVEFGGGDYYWRIDEVEADGTVQTGTIWMFTVPDYLIVDNFESYDNIDPLPGEPGVNRIFDKWIDGFGTLTNGALVGNDLPPYAETSIVHGGAQSLVYRYDNTGKTSEATLTLTKRDWTVEGVTKLSLWLRGDSANAAHRIFVALNGTAVVYHDDPAATQSTGWKEWVIDLAAFGTDLTNVSSITIGIGTKNAPAPGGGTGTMYFDEITLIR